jgi:DNA (cytosine-5)-methyltransferase 1
VGRARNLGTAGYSAEKDHRHFLYREYLKVLALMQPEVFVMENVKGILSSSVNKQKIFPQILDDLKQPSKALKQRGGHGYRIYSLVSEPDAIDVSSGPVYRDGSEYIIRSENFGIPQMRHRVILVGVRDDIDKTPELLEQNKPVAVDSIIGGMPALRSGLSRQTDGDEEWIEVMQSVCSSLSEKLHDAERDDQSSALAQVMGLHDADLKRGGRFVPSRKTGFRPGYHGDLKNWLSDPKLKGFLNHETRGHILADLERYLWCSIFANLHQDSNHPSPKSADFPEFLYPNHRSWTSGKFADRFRVQVRGKPATTITSHISKDGHYFIHYDPKQCRSLTVREAARVQTFPDNYFFEGNRTQQYVQVGNAVPPFLAIQIAERVYNLLN